MSIRKIILVLAMTLAVVGVQAQSRRPRKSTRAKVTHKTRPRVPDDFKGTGAGVYDLESDLPEDAAAKGSKVVKVDTISNGASSEVLIPFAEVDNHLVLHATASSPLDKIEVCDASDKVLRSTGMHKQSKASVDLNEFPKDQKLVIEFYGLNGSTQNIEVSH